MGRAGNSTGGLSIVCLAHVAEAQGESYGLPYSRLVHWEREVAACPSEGQGEAKRREEQTGPHQGSPGSLAGQKEGQAPIGSVGLCMDSASH